LYLKRIEIEKEKYVRENVRKEINVKSKQHKPQQEIKFYVDLSSISLQKYI